VSEKLRKRKEEREREREREREGGRIKRNKETDITSTLPSA